ncbi:MAG: response regulator [Spartobacteria bacterium]|nr:response regulator [Spartobacteria bacterium]
MEQMRILIVDDDEAIIALLERILAKDPLFDVFSTTRGLKALTILDHYSFDALICDFALPDLTGDEIIRQIKKKPHCPPFIMMISGIVKRLPEHPTGHLIFVKKPFQPDRILMALRQEYARKYRQRKQAGLE